MTSLLGIWVIREDFECSTQELVRQVEMPCRDRNWTKLSNYWVMKLFKAEMQPVWKQRITSLDSTIATSSQGLNDFLKASWPFVRMIQWNMLGKRPRNLSFWHKVLQVSVRWRFSCVELSTTYSHYLLSYLISPSRLRAMYHLLYI